MPQETFLLSSSSKWRFKFCFLVTVIVVLFLEGEVSGYKRRDLVDDDFVSAGQLDSTTTNAEKYLDQNNDDEAILSRNDKSSGGEIQPNKTKLTTKEKSTVRKQRRKEQNRRRKRDIVRRDPYLFNLFEILLSTLENKLRGVETMDRSISYLTRRMDNFERTLQESISNTNRILELVENKVLEPPPCIPTPTQPNFEPKNSPSYDIIEETLRDFNPGPSGEPSYLASEDPLNHFIINTRTGMSGASNILGAKLDVLADRMSIIDNKLGDLEEQISSSSKQSTNDDLIAQASENYRVNIGLKGGRLQQALLKDGDIEGVIVIMNQVFDSMEELNQRFMEHAALNTEQLEHMIENMVQVRQAMIIHEPLPITNSGSEFVVRQPHGLLEPVSKLDVLVDEVTPLKEIRKKMDEVWSVLVGTKSSVDVLVPKSDALLNNSQRQERAILQFSTNLSEKTDQIIQNLGQVEKKLESMPTVDSNSKSEESENSPNPVSLLHKTTNQLQQTAKSLQNFEASVSYLQNLDDDHKIPHNSTTSRYSSDSESPSTNHTQSNEGFLRPMSPSISNVTNFTTPSANDDTMGYSCSDLMHQGHTKSGNYHIRIRGTTYWFLKVNCEMEVEGGGWTVIQRRDNFGNPREDFNRDWNDYKHGFGDPEKEFYLGNENIYLLTNTQEHILRVELEDFEGNKRYAEYSNFKLHNEIDLYKLEIGGYKGNAGNSLNDPWYGSNLSPFSTHDRDNDRSSLNCASMLKGGWWWRSCGRGLNGLYLTKATDTTGRKGIVWFRWRGWDYSLKKSVILIRPKNHIEDISTTSKIKT